MAKLIFKIFPPAQSFHGVDYNEKKQQQKNARLIYFENFGHLQNKSTVSKEEFKEYLTLYSQRNKRVKLPQFHAVISCRGNDLSSEQLKEYAAEIMNRLGYAGNPTLMYEHTDTANRHLHIVSSRVDKNGKKINDAFEKKRANNILSEILQLATKEQFSRDLASSLLYQCSTEKQFLLLMELKGYQAKLNVHSGNFDFYKHGERQGSILQKEIIHRLAAGNPSDEGRKKIYSIIRYYKEKYSAEPIIHEGKKPYPRQPYQTALTEHLKKTFGWEFIFFRSGKHEKPYGYTIIDHAARKVYKGNEVMKLQELLNTNGAALSSTATGNKNMLQPEGMEEAVKTAAAVSPAPSLPVHHADSTAQDNSLPFVSTELVNEIGSSEIAGADSLAKRVIKPSKAKKKIKY